MKKNEFPIAGQEAEIKYKITNLKGEILDQTLGRQSFKFIVGDTQTIMKCISDTIKTMKYDEKKTIQINSDEEPNILDILGEDNASQNHITEFLIYAETEILKLKANEKTAALASEKIWQAFEDFIA